MWVGLVQSVEGLNGTKGLSSPKEERILQKMVFRLELQCGLVLGPTACQPIFWACWPP